MRSFHSVLASFKQDWLLSLLTAAIVLSWFLLLVLISNRGQSGNAAEEITRDKGVPCSECEHKKKHHVDIAFFFVTPIHSSERCCSERFGDRHNNNRTKQDTFYQEVQRLVGACQLNQPQVASHIGGDK